MASVSAGIPRELDQAAIDAVAQAHVVELKRVCVKTIERASEHRVDVIIEINARGGVVDVAAAGGGSAERPLRQCVEKHVRGWKFPAPSTGRTISATLMLSE